MTSLKKANKKMIFYTCFLLQWVKYGVKEEMSIMKKFIIGVILILNFLSIPVLEVDTLNRFNPGRLEVIAKFIS